MRSAPAAVSRSATSLAVIGTRAERRIEVGKDRRLVAHRPAHPVRGLGIGIDVSHRLDVGMVPDDLEPMAPPDPDADLEHSYRHDTPPRDPAGTAAGARPM